jgi:signal transduction histidine kinase
VHINNIKIIKLLDKLFPSLTAKIAVAMLFVFLLAGGGFVYFAHYTGYKMLERGSQSQAHGVAEFSKALLEYIMLNGENQQLQSALNRIVSTHQATDILILREDGEIALRASSGGSSEKIPLEKFRELPEYPGEKFLFINENGSTFEYIITPIVKRMDCYKCHTEPLPTKGFLGVKISMDDIRGVAMQHRTTNIVMTIVTFVGLGAMLFIALFFVVLRPIKKIRHQIGEVDQQIDKYEKGERVKFDELFISEREDEITSVMRAFNRLMHRLNDANEKIRDLHQIQMEHADRLATTGEMAAGIAHEIKNPIAGVLGALHIFDDETKADNERKEIIAEMIAQLERVNYAINDLLSYARPVKPEFTEIDIAEIIRRTIGLLSPQSKQLNVDIRTSLTENKILINADKKQVQQILWNISLNALQALDGKGFVDVLVIDGETNIKIEVKDTGRGIPVEQLSCVFQPFFTTKHKGTGLGMTITKRIIEQHGGTISVESIVNKGTTVTITLPKKQN